MPDLVTTPGAANANAYATAAEVTAVAETLWPRADAWLLADSDQQERAILTATRELDGERFPSERADADQALEWPRVGYTGIPDPVKRATARLAIWLVQQGEAEDPFAPDELAGVGEVRLGGELSVSGAGERIPAGSLYLAQVIRPILGDLVLPHQVRVIRG